MSRKTARENAFRLIYEYCVVNERNDLTLELLNTSASKEDAEYTTAIYNGVIENFALLKDVISKYSVDFVFDRIYKVDLAIIMLSGYEILFREDIPVAVSANEAVELTKIYSTDKSFAFVNGLLASIITHKEEILSEREDN